MARVATAADFHRLAGTAEARGLEVIQDAQGRYFVTSASDPFGLHTVTGWSCDCRGFISHGRCTHHSLFLQHLGWLPELEPELPFVEPEGEIDCPNCCGCGVKYFRSGDQPCEVCHGTGRRPAALPGSPTAHPFQPVATAA